MISAVSNTNSNLSFTSVVPVRVFVDGMETFNPKMIKSAARHLTSTLFGPASTNPHQSAIVKEYAKFDPDYVLQNGLFGHPRIKQGQKAQPSDYFRIIADNNASYLFSGEQAKKLKELGKAVGAEQFVCKTRGINSSYDLQVAKRNYGFCISNFIRSTKLRLRENFDCKTKIKSGDLVELNLHFNSNKKYGQNNFKMFLENISFTKHLT